MPRSGFGGGPSPMSMFGDMDCGSPLVLMFVDRGSWPESWGVTVVGSFPAIK